MQADAYLGSIADDDTPVGICTSHDCNNHAAPGYLMCRDCRDALDLTTEGQRPKKEAPVTRTQNPWTPDDDKTLAENAHLGVKAVAQLLGRTPSSVTQRAHTQGVSLRKRFHDTTDPQPVICDECGSNPATQVTEAGSTLCESCAADAVKEMQTRAMLEAEDEHDKIADRIEHHREKQVARMTIGVSVVRNNLATELAETKIRLAIAMLLSEPLYDTADVIAALDRAAELVSTNA